MFASYEFDYLADLRAKYGDALGGSPVLSHLFVNQNTANWFLGAGTLRNEVGGTEYELKNLCIICEYRYLLNPA